MFTVCVFRGATRHTVTNYFGTPISSKAVCFEAWRAGGKLFEKLKPKSFLSTWYWLCRIGGGGRSF